MTRPPSSRNDDADGSRWVRIWRRAPDSVDTILALTVVVVVGLLDLADRISPDVLNNATLLTLGTLALAMWRDRRRREPAAQKAQQAAEATSETDIVVKVLSDGSPYEDQSVDRRTPRGERTVG